MSAMQCGLRTRTWMRVPWIGRRVAMPLLVLATSACYRPPTDAAQHGSWTYEVQAPTAGSRVVTVEATFDGAHTERLGIPHDSVPWIKEMKVRSGNSYRSVERRGNEWF